MINNESGDCAGECVFHVAIVTSHHQVERRSLQSFPQKQTCFLLFAIKGGGGGKGGEPVISSDWRFNSRLLLKQICRNFLCDWAQNKLLWTEKTVNLGRTTKL